MTLLDHKFGNDGVCRPYQVAAAYVLIYLQMFWISYKDFLNKYEHLDRTRLFGPEWTVTQKWTSLQVPWSSAYHSTKFAIELSETGSVVIVLSQVFQANQKEESCETNATKLTSSTIAILGGWRDTMIFSYNFALKRTERKIISFEITKTATCRVL